MIASNETILIENHLKCAKQIKQIILFFFDEIQKFQKVECHEDIVIKTDYYSIKNSLIVRGHVRVGV